MLIGLNGSKSIRSLLTLPLSYITSPQNRTNPFLGVLLLYNYNLPKLDFKACSTDYLVTLSLIQPALLNSPVSCLVISVIAFLGGMIRVIILPPYFPLASLSILISLLILHISILSLSFFASICISINFYNSLIIKVFSRSEYLN